MSRFLEMGADVMPLSRTAAIEAPEAHLDACWPILHRSISAQPNGCKTYLIIETLGTLLAVNGLGQPRRLQTLEIGKMGAAHRRRAWRESALFGAMYHTGARPAPSAARSGRFPTSIFLEVSAICECHRPQLRWKGYIVIASVASPDYGQHLLNI